MSWKVRHEGSPRPLEGVTKNQIIQGLMDGQWEPTDEVLGPNETDWLSLESHPQFADLAQEIEPPERKVEDDETRLDMNALIDVCLVLLVFFILTTSYAALQKMLDMPGMTADRVGVPRITRQQVQQYMIKVEVVMDQDVPVVRVEGEEILRVEGEDLDTVPLVARLMRYVQGEKKTEMLLDHSPRCPQGVVVGIQDAARGAGINQVHVLVPKEELTGK